MDLLPSHLFTWVVPFRSLDVTALRKPSRGLPANTASPYHQPPPLLPRPGFVIASYRTYSFQMLSHSEMTLPCNCVSISCNVTPGGQGLHVSCSPLDPQSSEQSLDAKTSIWGIHKCSRPLRRLEALGLAPRVGNTNQDASQHFGNTKPSTIQFNARVQALGDSVLCFKHEASLCSSLSSICGGTAA